MKISKVGVLAFLRTREAFIGPTDLKALLAQHGFNANMVPTLDPVQRVRDASVAFRSGRIGRPTKLEILKQTTDSISIGVLFREEIKKGAEVNWRQGQVVTYDRNAGFMHIGVQTDEGEAFINTAKRWQANVDSGWLRNRFAIPEIERLGGFSIARGSNLYYVHQGESVLADLRGVCNSIGRTELQVIRIESDSDTIRAVGSAAEESLGGRIADTLAKFNAWREKVRGRNATVETMLAELADIRSLAMVLSSGLAFNLDEIERELSEAEKTMRDAIGENLAIRVRVREGVEATDQTGAFEGMSMLQAAEKVLIERYPTPLHYRVITELAIAEGLFASTGATPHNTLNAQLCVQLKQHPADSRFVRSDSGKGMWALRDAPKTVVVDEESKTMSAVDEILAGSPKAIRQLEDRTVLAEIVERGTTRQKALAKARLEALDAPQDPEPEPSGAAPADDELPAEPEAAPEAAPEPEATQEEPEPKKGQPEPEEAQPAPAPEPEMTVELEPEEPEEIVIPNDLDNMTATDRRKLARDLGIKGWMRMGPTQLISEIGKIREQRY